MEMKTFSSKELSKDILNSIFKCTFRDNSILSLITNLNVGDKINVSGYILTSGHNPIGRRSPVSFYYNTISVVCEGYYIFSHTQQLGKYPEYHLEILSDEEEYLNRK